MADRKYDVIILGASGFTGREAVRALLRQQGLRKGGTTVRWAAAGRSLDKLRATLADLQPARRKTDPSPGMLIADTTDSDSLRALAAQGSVLLNLAGPYAHTGEAVVQACIAQRTHYLDLSGETFWMREMIARHHAAAQAAKVRIIPCAGYEALPFDLAMLRAAYDVRERFGAPCREVKIVVSFRGKRMRQMSDVVSGGTVASMMTMLELDSTDCLSNPACLLPPDHPGAAAVAQRNALRLMPHYDADVEAVTAPTLPAPFINPPILLRTVALIDDETLFAPDFRYVESTHMGSLIPPLPGVPGKLQLPLQWAAAAAVAAPIAHLRAVVAGPLRFERDALRRLIEMFAPASGAGPSEEALAGSGYAFDVFATAAKGETLHTRIEADGHPGYRSTPEMLVAVGADLALGTLGRTPHCGVVTPAAGLGVDAMESLKAAGVRYES